jgi:phosphopantothenoylcysteine synthetase/decarboxylase
MVSIVYKWLMIFTWVNFTMLPANSEAPVTHHPLFVSVTEIEHNAKDKTLEISCKIFTDDFEKTLRQTYKGTVDLVKPADKTAMNKLVSDYVQKHLQISADGKKTTLQFLGYEQEEEGIVSFYQVNNIASVKKIDVTNNILYEYKKEQMGIIHATVGGNRKSTKLNNPDSNTGFEF